MNIKTAVSALTVVLAVMAADPKSCKSDTPAGSDRGDSAGNNQPDAGRLEQCAAPQPIDIDPIVRVERAGVTYIVTAYLMDEDCDIVDVDQEVMKVTLVATDASGRRLPPAHNSIRSGSPYNAKVDLAVPVGFSIEIIAVSDMTAPQKIDNGVAFMACQILPTKAGPPTSVKLVNADKSRGSKVECSVKG